MPDTGDTHIQIRCPKCGQRFKVGPELQGKVVECGRCESRFRVNDEVIQRTKKFYPGEKRRDPALDRFPRSAGTMAQVPAGFQAVTYESEVSPEMVEPPTMPRVLAGMVGAVAVVLTLLVFLVSGRSGGFLGAIGSSERFMLAGFVAVLGSGLFIYANRRRRWLAVVISFAWSALLVAMPVLFPAPEKPSGLALSRAGEAPAGKPTEFESTPREDAMAALKREMGYLPMANELDGAPKREAVAGVWLRNMQERNRFQIRDYLIRATGAGEASHMYPRSDTDFLFVLTGLNRELEAVASACERIGRVERIIRELQVIEVVVDNERFVEGAIERLNNRTDDGYYALNLRELESVDLGRVVRAVERLTDAPTTQFRSDIVRRMMQLLGEVTPEQQGKIARALAHWSQPGDGAEEAVLKAVQKLDAKQAAVPDEMVRFLVARRELGVLPVLHRMWRENPEGWESLCIDTGVASEDHMLEVLADGQSRASQSAVRILARVGTAKSIPGLEKACASVKGEFRLLVEKALSQVKQRAGQ